MNDYDREARSLPVHVASCKQRYYSLFKRLGRIEGVLIGVAAGVLSLVLTLVGVVLTAFINRGIGP